MITKYELFWRGERREAKRRARALREEYEAWAKSEFEQECRAANLAKQLASRRPLRFEDQRRLTELNHAARLSLRGLIGECLNDYFKANPKATEWRGGMYRFWLMLNDANPEVFQESGYNPHVVYFRELIRDRIFDAELKYGTMLFEHIVFPRPKL